MTPYEQVSFVASDTGFRWSVGVYALREQGGYADLFVERTVAANDGVLDRAALTFHEFAANLGFHVAPPDQLRQQIEKDIWTSRN